MGKSVNPTEASQGPTKILMVVPDEEDFRLLKELLARARPDGLETVWEPDPVRGLEIACAGSFQAVLLDRAPGDLSVSTFLREARRKNLAAPVLILTARADDAARKEDMAEGAADSLPRDRINAFVLDRAILGSSLVRKTLDLAYDCEDRFLWLFKSSREALLLHDGRVVLDANPAASLLFGFSASDWTGRDLATLFAPEGREEVLKPAGEAPPEGVETSILKKGSGAVPVRARSLLFPSALREVRMLALSDKSVVQDLDREIQFLLQRLRKDGDQLARAEQLKDEFLSSVSGDLRSPLTAIVGYLKLLTREGFGPLNPGQRDAAEAADKSARHLSGLVEDLLDMARLDPSSMPLEFKECAVEPLVGEALAGSDAFAEAKHVILMRDVAPGTAHLDPAKIGRVLNHLLRNALKFTQDGGIVQLSAQPGRDGQRWGWLFSVKDSGPGIPEEERERVFGRFFLMGEEAARRTGGTGVGLAVSRRIVEAHGGRIWAEGLPDGPGVVFKVFLPEITA